MYSTLARKMKPLLFNSPLAVMRDGWDGIFDGELSGTVNDVPILDAMLVQPPEAGEALDAALGILVQLGGKR